MPKGPNGEMRPADVIGAAVKVMKIATGESTEAPADSGFAKDPAAVAMGRKGGVARARNLGPNERSDLASKAARSRWAKSH